MNETFVTKAQIMRSFSTLNGLIMGISADQIVTKDEVLALRRWVKNNLECLLRPPFSSVKDAIEEALLDNKITLEELENIKFVCRNVLVAFPDDLKSTKKIQELHGAAAGIASDGKINASEWQFLKTWISENESLKGTWPYDEIEALTSKHLKIESLSQTDIEMILHYFNDFGGLNENRSLTHPLNEPNLPITAICAICPDIVLKEKTFCLTGKSVKYPREKIATLISSYGGKFKDGMSKGIDYLIVCSDGSPHWAYSCYGRKVEQAVSLRKQGEPIIILNEFDLWDHFKDLGYND